MSLLKCALIVVTIECAVGANILFFTAIPSPSHHIYNRVLAFGLAEKGHNVTLVGNDLEKEKHPNLHFIWMEGAYEATEDFDIQAITRMNSFESVTTMYEWGNYFCFSDFKSNGLKQLMNYPMDFKFDLLIYDVTLGQCLYPIIDRFNRPPVVAITAFILPHYLANAMGSHVYPSYYPHYILHATNNMRFFERIQSFFLTYWENWYRNKVFGKKQYEMMKDHFGENVRTVEEYERDFQILLSNIDPHFDYPVSMPPNIIPIGGMHARPAKPLPKDLEAIMAEAKHGVILFSLGTNIKSSLLSQKVKDELMAAFSRLKQTVVWKYEKELANVPKNVVIRKWLPQNDILGHPKCVLFISHGGGLSTQEAMYHGVPVVGIPGFGDQHRNVHRFVSKGLGLKLDFNNINKDIVYNAVQEVLSNPTFKNNIKAISKKYHDQPQTPLERAIFWTEYVLRNGGAKELELPARDMYFFQTANLDVALFLIAVPLLCIFVISKCLRLLFCGQKKNTKLKKN